MLIRTHGGTVLIWPVLLDQQLRYLLVLGVLFTSQKQVSEVFNGDDELPLEIRSGVVGGGGCSNLQSVQIFLQNQCLKLGGRVKSR
jgi:hypothetical protein